MSVVSRFTGALAICAVAVPAAAFAEPAPVRPSDALPAAHATVAAQPSGTPATSATSYGKRVRKPVAVGNTVSPLIPMAGLGGLAVAAFAIQGKGKTEVNISPR